MSPNLLSSEMLARIIDGSPIPSFVINNKHRVTHWNTAIEALSGLKKSEIIGSSQHWRAFYAQERPTLADLIVNGSSSSEIRAYYVNKCRESSLIKGAYEAEDHFSDLGINGKWLHFTASPIKDSNGAVIGAIETLEDITESRSAVEALHESEKNFRALFESANDAIWVSAGDGKISAANKAASELTGYTVPELLKMNESDLLDLPSLSLSQKARTNLLQNRPFDSPYEQIVIKKDGTEAICMVTTSLIMRDGDCKGFQNIVRDVTHEKRMQENLRFYLKQITRAQEEERRRISRELHDDTVQVLTSLSRQLDTFINRSINLPEEDLLFLTEMKARLNQGAQSVHRFCQDLRLSVLDDFGLIPALRSLVKNIQEYNDLEIELQVYEEEKRLPGEVELLLFRIVQEALNNVVRHAQASRVKVSLTLGDNGLHLKVSDNGIGLNQEIKLDELPRDGKLGLAGILERTGLLGGNLNIVSSPQQGTTITVGIPLDFVFN